VRRTSIPAIPARLFDGLQLLACTVVARIQSLFERGVELYADRPDRGWSPIGCIAFVGVPEHGITEALTWEHHFEQASFTALLNRLGKNSSERCHSDPALRQRNLALKVKDLRDSSSPAAPQNDKPKAFFRSL
jgi:hypothetical protein